LFARSSVAIIFHVPVSPIMSQFVMLAKRLSHQLPYSSSSGVSSTPLELVYSDMWGPAPDFVGGKKYYVSFIDSFNKFAWIYLLKFKSEVFQKLHEFQSLVERFFDRKNITMQTDLGEGGGGEGSLKS
jgi:hypothetical protein